MTDPAHSLYMHVSQNMTGRIAQSMAEAKLLVDTIQPGDLYIEVGTLWGGTTLLAASKAIRVITIDFMRGGFWIHGDPGMASRAAKANKNNVTNKPTPGIVLSNLANFGVAHKVNVVRAPSHPWPIPMSIHPDVMLIDGGHSYDQALLDWDIAVQIAKRAILVHDYHRGHSHPGVKRMVDDHALMQDVWTVEERADSLVLFTRA